MKKAVVIIPCAGLGTRFGGDVPKQFVELLGIPVAVRTLKIFDDLDFVDSIIVPIDPEWQGFVNAKADLNGVKKSPIFVEGGAERQDSVYNASRLEVAQKSDYVIVHDAARPLASPRLVEKTFRAAIETGGAVCGLNPVETIKEGEIGGLAKRTLDRSALVSVQTPQAFKTELFVSVYERAAKDGTKATDDAALFEKYELPVKIVEGEPSNVKITTKVDLYLAEAILKR